MEKRPFGKLGEISCLTLGGGGTGQVWGPTSLDEAIATTREAVDAAPRRPGTARRKVLVFLPGQIDWLATAVQSVGTVEFNVSTFVAIWATAGSAQAQHHVWRPDILGSACFLVASALAWFEACHGWARRFAPKEIPWAWPAMNHCAVAR